MTREWFIFFQHLNTLVGGGSNVASLTDLQLAPNAINSPEDVDTADISVLQGYQPQQVLEEDDLAPIVNISEAFELVRQLDSAPVTKTADFTLGTEKWVINNKAASTCTVTLPAASSARGREVTFKNMQAFTLVSASSNVVPIDSTSTGTSILLGVVGNWATMVSDGTNWVIMQQAPNNILLLE